MNAIPFNLPLVREELGQIQKRVGINPSFDTQVLGNKNIGITFMGAPEGYRGSKAVCYVLSCGYFKSVKFSFYSSRRIGNTVSPK